QDHEAGDSDTACQRVVAAVVVEEREVLEPVDGAHERRKAVDKPAEYRDGGCSPRGEGAAARTGAEGEREGSGGESEEGELHGKRGDVAEGDPTTAGRYAEDQSDPDGEGHDEHDQSDCERLGQDQARAADRMGEYEREDAILLFARGHGGCPGDGGRAGHEGGVDDGELAAEPARDAEG